MKYTLYIIWNSNEKRPAIGREYGNILAFIAKENAQATLADMQMNIPDFNYEIREVEITIN